MLLTPSRQCFLLSGLSGTHEKHAKKLCSADPSTWGKWSAVEMLVAMAYGGSGSHPVTCTSALGKSSQELPRVVVKVKNVLGRQLKGLWQWMQKCVKFERWDRQLAKWWLYCVFEVFSQFSNVLLGGRLRCKVTSSVSFPTRTILSQALQALLIADPVLWGQSFVWGQNPRAGDFFFHTFPTSCG